MIKAGEELLRLQAENQRLKEGIKQAREEIENLETQIQSYHNDNPMISQAEVLAILDRLIESEG